MRDLPTERLVLVFGIAIAASAYVYWTVVGLGRGDDWSSVPANRALIVLGGVLLLAGLLRLIRAIDES